MHSLRQTLSYTEYSELINPYTSFPTVKFFTYASLFFFSDSFTNQAPGITPFLQFLFNPLSLVLYYLLEHQI